MQVSFSWQTNLPMNKKISIFFFPAFVFKTNLQVLTATPGQTKKGTGLQFIAKVSLTVQFCQG